MEFLSGSIPAYGTKHWGDKKFWAGMSYPWVSKPFCASKRPDTFMTAAELFDGDTGNSPRKDSIQDCQHKAMGTESGQTITRWTTQLGKHGLRNVRADGSLSILDNANIKGRLLVSAHLNEAEPRGGQTRVQRWFIFCVWKGTRRDLKK